jgi:hypothetical protein
MNPSERAVASSLDEKTQIRAFGRTQSSLPVQCGRGVTVTGDDKPHGTPNSFVALNRAFGRVLNDTKVRHLSEEVLDFCKFIHLHVTNELDTHVVRYWLSAHNAEPIVTWFADPERVRPYQNVTPISSLWLNLAEGTSSSVNQLEDDIGLWTVRWTVDPKPFNWMRAADEIIEQISRGQLALAPATSATDSRGTLEQGSIDRNAGACQLTGN